VTRAKSGRRNLVEALIGFKAPISSLVASLRDYGWDSQQELAILGPPQIVEVLRRFCKGELEATEIEEWANALESREDVKLVPKELVSTIIFDLANPTIQGELTLESAAMIMERLRKQP
jgi:hypothetical protein